jgi:uncharacterized protein YjiS (DUF1127 family)
MATLVHRSLTNSQLSQVRSTPRESAFARVLRTLRHWQRQAHERRQLVRLSDSELKDFGATRGDVERELATPIWRSLPPF